MKKYFFLFIIIIISTTCFAQSWQDTITLIEKTLSRYKPQNPGCQLAISRNGEVIYSKAWDMADLEHSITLSTASVIEAGSVSKQFTAAAILLLAQQGKLSLDDDVRKYIPELPDYGVPIKLRQMMHHTSGLRDWGAIAELTGWPRSTKTYSNEDALEIISRQQRLNFKPGDEFGYSNSNYNLFAIIVQRISGMSLADFTYKNIFLPAGMIHTQWRDNFKRIVPNRAIAYALTETGYETDMPNENVYGNGGLLTTAEDLLKWNNYYLNGKLGNPSLLSTQIAVAPFNNGVINNYGAGLFINHTMGMDYIGHSGATASYRANLESFPQLNLTVAFLSNTSQFDTSAIYVPSVIRNIFVRNNTPAAAKAEKEIVVSAEKLKSLVGWYRNDRSGEGIQLVLKDNKIVFDNRTPLTPVKENLFSTGTNRIFFDPPHGLSYIIPERDTIQFTKVDSTNPSTISLNDYIGEYYSGETNSSITLHIKNDTLRLHIKPDGDYPLISSYKDAFKIPDFGGDLYFERNAINKCIKMKVSISRARNVEFLKIN